MSFFGLSKSSDRYGVLVDIGSGSVLTAIVHSDPKQTHPQIIWSQREHAPLRNVDSLEQSAKAVMTSLINSSMLLDTEGRTVLHDYDSSATLSELQCSISAPWSYTVTKSVNYKQEDPFVITDSLLKELTSTAQQQIKSDLAENEAIKNLGLQVVARVTMDTLSNGYRVANPRGQKAKQLTMYRTSVVAQEYLIDAIEDMRDKLFPQAEGRKLSFILMLHEVTKELLSQSYDVCLVDVTYEATEIGVVRDGVLQYCTHTPFGSFSLAREISAITNTPLHEAFACLHSEKPTAFLSNLSEAKQKDVEAVFEAYVQRLTELFHETGDELSIPKTISLHTEIKSEPFFVDAVEKAAKRCLKTEPHITPISSEIIKRTYTDSTKEAKIAIPNDTALLLSAQFFHKRPQRSGFEYQ